MLSKLMKVKEYSDGDSFWRVACDCGSPEHDVNLWFDASSDDKKDGTVNLNLSMEIGAREHYSYRAGEWWYPIHRFFENLQWRFSVAFKVLFSGYYTMTGDVILDLEGINAMQTALNEGLLHAKKSH